MPSSAACRFGRLGLLVREHVEQHLDRFRSTDEAQADENGLVLAGLGWNLQARRHGRHGTGRAQVPEQIGGLEGHDAGADFVEVELARHFGNLGILFVEQGDQRSIAALPMRTRARRHSWKT